MIYIHKKKYGKRLITTVYHDEKRAREDYELCGGELIECVEIGEAQAIKDLIVDEISCLIDDMTNHSPGSPWEHPGSPVWDITKVETLNRFRELLNEI